ncbi:MAG: TetR family transcriptional regulator C-terminal domain-containing protein [Alphaproteobacteria bacterium]
MATAGRRATIAAARPRKERAENAAMRRRQLVAAAARSIVENGLARTTLATVSAASGLSQGVAVFYFGTKEQLFAEVLRQQYEAYQTLWRTALAGAGSQPAEQLAALIRADFDPSVCNADALAIWHAFWGEASARPLYAEISEHFDNERAETMRAVCARLLGASERSAAEIGAGIDALTDGLWLRIHLSNGALSAADGLKLAADFVVTVFPQHTDHLAAALLRT